MPQGLVLGSVLFNIFINDLEERVNSALIKFTDFNIVRSVINMTVGKEIMPKEFRNTEISKKRGFLLKKCRLIPLKRIENHK